MTVLYLLVALAALLIVCGTAVAITDRRVNAQREAPVADEAPATGWLDERTRSRVSVHTLEGETIDGLLVEVDATGLVLTDAKHQGDDEVELAGDQFVPRDRVRFVQVMTS